MLVSRQTISKHDRFSNTLAKFVFTNISFNKWYSLNIISVNYNVLPKNAFLFGDNVFLVTTVILTCFDADLQYKLNVLTVRQFAVQSIIIIDI